MATTKKISGYRIDFTTDTLIMNYKFYAASQQYGSPEYNLVKSITKDFPNLTVSVQAGRASTSHCSASSYSRARAPSLTTL